MSWSGSAGHFCNRQCYPSATSHLFRNTNTDTNPVETTPQTFGQCWKVERLFLRMSSLRICFKSKQPQKLNREKCSIARNHDRGGTVVEGLTLPRWASSQWALSSCICLFVFLPCCLFVKSGKKEHSKKSWERWWWVPHSLGGHQVRVGLSLACGLPCASRQ